MTKKFKTRKRKKSLNKQHILSMFLLITIYLTIKFIYNSYVTNLTKEKVINDIINTKFNTNIDIKDHIIKEYFSTNESKPVIKEEPPKKEVDIYIYSTHDTESYSDFYSKTYSIKPNIKTASLILEEELEKYNINTYVEKESTNKRLKKNNWSYKYSYKASREIIQKKIKDNNYKLIIDLHRDSGSHSKTTITYNKNNYAKVLFVIGTEYDTYKDNYKIAKKISDYLNSEIKNISRGIILKGGVGVNGIYNQDLNKNIILIELGGEENEIEELNNTIEILAKCINKYMGEL